jgi:hypothetical protein
MDGFAWVFPTVGLVAITFWAIVAVVLRRRRDPSPALLMGEDSISFKCSASIGRLNGSYPLGRVTIDRNHLVLELAGLARATLRREEVLEIRHRRLTGYWIITPQGRRLRFSTPSGRNREELEYAAALGWPLEIH